MWRRGEQTGGLLISVREQEMPPARLMLTMRGNRLSVIEPLELRQVRQFGRRLRLAVTDKSHRRHVISFRCTTESVATDYLPRLIRWMDERTPLAYVRGTTDAALLEIETLLARATS